jgi:ArsR family transcriptional regulator
VSEINELAGMFKALGDPTRLRMFQFLQHCCCEVAVAEDGGVAETTGPTAGEVCCFVTGESKVTSTVSFHLKELRNAGLITMERRGKHMICGCNPQAVQRLAQFLGGDSQ